MVSFAYDVRYAEQHRPIDVRMWANLPGDTAAYEPVDVIQQGPEKLRDKIEEEYELYVRSVTDNPHPTRLGLPLMPRLLGRVRGMLELMDQVTHRTAMVDQIAIADITPDMFWTLLERANQSGASLDPYDCIWLYYIDVRTAIGGSGSTIRSSNLRGIRPLSLDTYYTAEDQPIACAAVSIFLHLAYTREDLYPSSWARNGKVKREIVHQASLLQTEIGWTDSFVLIDDLRQFVDLDRFSDCRVVVVMPNATSSACMEYRGSRYVYDAEETSRTIYLYLGFNRHYCCVKSPAELVSACRGNSGGGYMWCHRCLSNFQRRLGHTCEDIADDPDQDVDAVHILPPAKKRRTNITCHLCGLSMNPDNERHHSCGKMKCKICHLYYDRGTRGHRCPLYTDQFETPSRPFVTCDAEADTKGKRYAVWVYDIESHLVPVEDGPRSTTTVFKSTESGEFERTGTGQIRTYTVQAQDQVPNLICYRNVFDVRSPTRIAYSLEQFLNDMSNYNGGRNICLAHNASGYDARLVFNTALRMVGSHVEHLKPILRGGKFMRLEINKLIFMDTMLHLRGRLKDLSKQFFPDHEDLHKGYFPHLFNLPEHQTYIGPIPDKKYFDLSFSCKNQAELDEFHQWHASYHGEWDFQKEILAYCKQDVEILARIVESYHSICLEKLVPFDPCLAISPWESSTSASYVHRLFQRYHSKMLDVELAGEADAVDRLAHDTWCVLEPEEYYFDRCALRGGRTDIRQFHHEVTDAQWDAGERIRYVDVVSMYPFVQVAREYPVGPPAIHIYDPAFLPCKYHFEHPLDSCACSIRKRRGTQNPKLLVVEHRMQPTREYLDSFFGIICCDVQPPDHLYHPVLVHYDQQSHKCLASLEPITKGVFTSVEFQEALRHGYTVSRVHRIHEYKSAPSKWCGLMEELFKLKLYNSKPPRSEEVARHMRHAYAERFDIEVDPSQCEERPAIKQTFKILFNSAWGKHAETVDHMQALVVNENDTNAVAAFMQSVSDSTHQVCSFDGFEHRTLFRYKHNRKKCQPDLHKGYLPAALFVPAYGRLLLFEQMHKLGERVLMHDTDSIVYVGQPGQYDVPTGCVWGDWEIDDFETKHQGIREFVALGPKTYGLRGSDGTRTFKCKGLSLKHGHRDILNFEVAKNVLLRNEMVMVPQFTFVYTMGRSMRTHHFQKRVAFDRSLLKGVYESETTKLYPYGHQHVRLITDSE